VISTISDRVQIVVTAVHAAVAADDGIGPDVFDADLRVLQAATSRERMP
jgi:hypothetical protein